jgi:hypothetical protein
MPPKAAARFTRAAAKPGLRPCTDADPNLAVDLTTQRGEDLVVLGETSFGLLREDKPPVGDHVVLALRALDRLRVVALVGQLSRETRGSLVVAVSDGAVEDLDAHAGAS